MGRRPYDREWLTEALRMLAGRLGHTPTRVEADAEPDFPCYKTYVRHFGSWNAALKAAEMIPNRRAVRYDRESLLEALQQLATRLGRAPAARDLPKWGLHCAITYAKHFGSWRAALAAIGLQPRIGGRRYEREDLLAILRNLTQELGRGPTQAELGQKDGLPHASTYKYHFGGWNRALEAAGVTPLHPKGRQENKCETRS